VHGDAGPSVVIPVDRRNALDVGRCADFRSVRKSDGGGARLVDDPPTLGSTTIAACSVRLKPVPIGNAAVGWPVTIRIRTSEFHWEKN
jgi:hypothetical protein